MPRLVSTRYRFGLYEFDSGTLELRREGSPVPLQGQPAALLALLVTHSDRLVSKEEMIGHLWGDSTHVNFQESLSFCLKQLRKALGDQPENPVFIQTVPRRGCRFIAPTARVEPERTAKTVPPATSPLERAWVRNAVWFVLALVAVLVAYFIFEDFPR